MHGCNLQELALRWSIARAPRRSEQQTLGAFHLATHLVAAGKLNDAKETVKTLRKIAPRSEAATELAAMVTAALGEKPEVEMRIDASDGQPYPFTSFQEVYGPQVRRKAVSPLGVCSFRLELLAQTPVSYWRLLAWPKNATAALCTGGGVLGDRGASTFIAP